MDKRRIILKEITGTSAVIFFLRNLSGFYHALKRKIIQAYVGSYIHSFIACFTEFIEKEDPAILRNSKFGQRIVSLYDKLQRRTADYLNVSLTGGYAESLKRGFRLSPIRISGIILVSALVINSILSFLFHRKLGTMGAAIRAILLIIGICGISCDINWATIKGNSVLLKILFR